MPMLLQQGGAIFPLGERKCKMGRDTLKKEGGTQHFGKSSGLQKRGKKENLGRQSDRVVGETFPDLRF